MTTSAWPSVVLLSTEEMPTGSAERALVSETQACRSAHPDTNQSLKANKNRCGKRCNAFTAACETQSISGSGT